MRHRRYRRRAARFRILGWLALVAVVAGVAMLIAELSLPADMAPSGVVRRLTPAPEQPQLATPVTPSGPGTVFRHSVIPGGVRTGDELQAAIDSDPVVAEHHADVIPANMHPATLQADRLVHMSYRKGDAVYWTKHKVLLRQGEAVLTDGDNYIRARCGNDMSFDAMLPTEDNGPDPEEFEQVVIRPSLLASRILDTLGTGDPFLLPDPFVGLFMPPVWDPIGPGTSWFYLDPDRRADSPQGFAGGTVDSPDALLIEAILDPGGDLLPPVSDPGDDPSMPRVPPLVRLPPPGSPGPGPEDFPDPDSWTPGGPLEETAAVPEPATLLLVGGAVGALLARRRMSRGR